MTAPLDDDLTPVTDPRKDELTSDVPEAPGDEEDTGVPDEGVDDTPDDTDEEEAAEPQGGTSVKILGREPSLWLAFLTAVVSLAGTFGLRFLAPDQAALWNIAILAVAGAVTAYTVRPIAPAAFTYAVGAIVQLAAAYGLNVTDPQLSMLNALVVPTLMLLTRGQVSPIETAVSKASKDPTPEAALAEAEAAG